MRSDIAVLASSLWSAANMSAKQSRLLISLPLLVLACLFGLQVLRGSVLYEGWVQDAFIHLNGILHIEAGNLPHKGFSTPIGAFYYLAHYLTTFFAPPSAFTAVYANGLVAALATFLSVLTGYRRLHAGWTAILTLYVGTVAMSPRQLGELFLSFNASYNSWSWAFIAVLAVVVSIPRVDAERRQAALMDGILSAVLLGLLFFTKATYAVVGLVLIAASVATVRRRFHPSVYAIWAAVILVLTIIVVEASFSIVLPYLSDLQRAAQVPGASRVQQLILTIYVTGSDVILILMIGACSLAISYSTGSLSTAAYLLILISAGLAVSAQNHMAFEIALVPVSALAASILFKPRQDDSPRPDLVSVVIAVSVFLLFLRPTIINTATILEESLTPSSSGPDVAWLRSTPLKDLAFRASPNAVVEGGNCLKDSPTVSQDREFIAVFGDGVRLLRKHRSGEGRVLSLTWTNPFPVLVGAPPAPSDLSWWDPLRTFNATNHPRAETLLREVDYVMIPKYKSSNTPTTEQMLKIYGAEISRRFKALEESGCWRLMGRIDPVERP
jgi:hypothetical protein